MTTDTADPARPIDALPPVIHDTSRTQAAVYLEPGLFQPGLRRRAVTSTTHPEAAGSSLKTPRQIPGLPWKRVRETAGPLLDHLEAPRTGAVQTGTSKTTMTACTERRWLSWADLRCQAQQYLLEDGEEHVSVPRTQPGKTRQLNMTRRSFSGEVPCLAHGDHLKTRQDLGLTLVPHRPNEARRSEIVRRLPHAGELSPRITITLTAAEQQPGCVHDPRAASDTAALEKPAVAHSLGPRCQTEEKPRRWRGAVYRKIEIREPDTITLTES